MKGIFLVGLLSLAAFACQPVVEAKRPYTVYAQPWTFFRDTLVSQPSRKVLLANDEYPVYLTMNENKTFHYNLPNLSKRSSVLNFGEGDGTWAYSSDGYIRLHADRVLFVMDFQIRAKDTSDSNALSLEFSDRFGPKFLPLEVRDQ